MSMKNTNYTYLLFLLLPLVLVGYFVYVCIGFNFLISLTDSTSGTLSFNFIGWKNYADLLTDSLFITSFINVLKMILVFIPTIISLGLFLAILLDQNIKGKLFFRTIYLLPFALPSVVTGTLWTWMYYPEGPVNAILKAVGLNLIVRDWLGDPNVVLYSIIIALIWQLLGYVVLILYSGIISLPISQRRAAEVDGAKGFKLYWYIIIPQIKGPLLMAYSFCVLYIVPLFDIPYVLTRGGPGTVSYTLAIYMYKQSFMISRFSYGAAIAAYLFIMMILLMVPYFYLMRAIKR